LAGAAAFVGKYDVATILLRTIRDVVRGHTERGLGR
jgi:hypothetical protein